MDLIYNKYGKIMKTGDTSVTYYSKANRISEALASDLQHGAYTGNILLPSENALAGRYGASRITMRRAIDILVDTGMLVRVPSRGVRRVETLTEVPPSAAGQERVGTIAVAWFGWEDAFLLEIRSGIREYADEHHLAVRFFSDNWRHEPIIRFFDEIESHGVDGVITIPYPDECYERSLGRLQSAGFPLVCVDRSLKNLELNVVTVDNIGGAYESTRRLIRRQHRPVWFFGQRNEASSNFARYQGYRQAMCEAGYEEEAGRMLIETDYVVPNPEHWPVEPAPERIRRFLKERCAFPISILACNDGHALATYHAAEELGLAVGRDIFIAGFDDIPKAAELEPPLTTVHQPRREIGLEAAQLLHKLMRRELRGPVRVTLPVTLVGRDSD